LSEQLPNLEQGTQIAVMLHALGENGCFSQVFGKHRFYYGASAPNSTYKWMIFRNKGPVYDSPYAANGSEVAPLDVTTRGRKVISVTCARVSVSFVDFGKSINNRDLIACLRNALYMIHNGEV
jgi:hypothetical protein